MYMHIVGWIYGCPDRFSGFNYRGVRDVERTIDFVCENALKVNEGG